MSDAPTPTRISTVEVPNDVEPFLDTRPRASLSILLSDDDANAVWEISVYAKGYYGVYALVGRVRTVPPANTFGVTNRVVALAFCPGALTWCLKVDPIFEGPNRPVWSGRICLEASEFVGGCCAIHANDPFAVKLPLAQ